MILIYEKMGLKDYFSNKNDKNKVNIKSEYKNVESFMDLEELKKKINEIKWWHQIDLGNGIITPGQGKTADLFKRLGLPENLKGKTVLDIGAWDGFYSFECEKKGASRVLATDSFVWKYRTKDGFDLAKKVLKSKVEEKLIDVLDISPETVGTFDIVLFSGVLYHMRHPLLSLEKVYSVTKEMAIIETATDMLDIQRPAMAFYPENELHGDPTNWFGPNPSCVEAMLKVVGFRKVELHFSAPIAFRKTGAKGSNMPDIPLSERILTNRVVFHAWK